MELQNLFRRESAAETFLKESDNITYLLFSDPNNGVVFGPELETSLSGLGDRISPCRFKNGGHERRQKISAGTFPSKIPPSSPLG
jgi:hypothetical protein